MHHALQHLGAFGATVSGNLEGGFMAAYLQVKFSDQIEGAGILHGSPLYYSCVMDEDGFNECDRHFTELNLDQLNLDQLYHLTDTKMPNSGEGLKNKPIWIFSGRDEHHKASWKDSLAHYPANMRKLKEYFEHYGS